MKGLKVILVFLMISAMALSAYSQFLTRKMKRLEEIKANAESQIEWVTTEMPLALN